MEHKTFPITDFKALWDKDDPGTFEAVVAVFGNVDRGGDRVQRGAFTRTLKERGLPPIVWSHNWDIPPIGVVKSATETSEGLKIKGRLFVGDNDDHPFARQVYTAMKATDGNGQAPLREFSFGYEPRDFDSVREDDKDIRVLKDLDLFEVGPTLVGMNPATRLVGIKALATEVERVAEELHRDETPEAAGVAEEATAATAAVEEEQEDKPKPKPEGEEAAARIRALQVAKPEHLE